MQHALKWKMLVLAAVSAAAFPAYSQKQQSDVNDGDFVQRAISVPAGIPYLEGVRQNLVTLVKQKDKPINALTSDALSSEENFRDLLRRYAESSSKVKEFLPPYLLPILSKLSHQCSSEKPTECVTKLVIQVDRDNKKCILRSIENYQLVVSSPQILLATLDIHPSVHGKILAKSIKWQSVPQDITWIPVAGHGVVVFDDKYRVKQTRYSYEIDKAYFDAVNSFGFDCGVDDPIIYNQ